MGQIPKMPHKLLFVEHHDRTRNNTTVGLRRDGYSVIEAADLDSAIAAYKPDEYDALIIDPYMQGDCWKTEFPIVSHVVDFLKSFDKKVLLFSSQFPGDLDSMYGLEYPAHYQGYAPKGWDIKESLFPELERLLK